MTSQRSFYILHHHAIIPFLNPQIFSDQDQEEILRAGNPHPSWDPRCLPHGLYNVRLPSSSSITNTVKAGTWKKSKIKITRQEHLALRHDPHSAHQGLPGERHLPPPLSRRPWSPCARPRVPVDRQLRRRSHHCCRVEGSSSKCQVATWYLPRVIISYGLLVSLKSEIYHKKGARAPTAHCPGRPCLLLRQPLDRPPDN